MYATERHSVVERLLMDEGRVTVVDLADRFGITTETVRRDLDHLESTGVLRRVHGGAVPVGSASTSEPSLSARRTQHGAAKAAIGRRARSLIPPEFNGSIYVDAGTTTAAVADELAPSLSSDRIELVTHSLSIAYPLSELPHISLTLIGGRLRGLTSAAVGASAVRTIEGLRPDIAFVGVNGISAGFGLSTPDVDEAAVKTAIVSSARRVVVVADSDKFEHESLVSFAGLTDVDVLVTDKQPVGELRDALRAADVEVRIA